MSATPAPVDTASVPLALQLVSVALLVLQRTLRHNRVSSDRAIQSHYDFVVVGAGSAGSVVASRLSESAAASVLVLEAGGPETVIMPALAPGLAGTEVDWSYRTVSQSPRAGNANAGHVHLTRGRVLGGGHNLNFLGYSRGNRRDYDRWATEYGATGWSYREVLPYFRRSENNVDEKIVAENGQYHGTTGPMVVQTPSIVDPIVTIILDTLVGMGYPQTDQNGHQQLGINHFQQTIFLNGTKSTTASAYLEPFFDRSNLQVVTRTLVTRILFESTSTVDGTLPRAIGVEYEREGGHRKRVFAKREVILSAGSINTPQLLMLSGIGPREHLTQRGLATLVDLPVGFNLMDHVQVLFDFTVLPSNLTSSSSTLSIENMYEYFTYRPSPLARFPMLYMYMNTDYNQAQPDWPDVQITFNVLPVPNDLDTLVNQKTDRAAWREYYRPHVGESNHLVVGGTLFRAASRGRVMLNDTDVYGSPLIDPRYLSEPEDLARFVEVTRRALYLTHRPPLSRWLRMWQGPIPGCELCDDLPIWECVTYIECYIAALAMTVNHQAGTTKMGQGPDSVVDPQLRVHNVRGLRVIDGSIMPAITNGNVNAPIVMIAERGAQFIRDEHHI